MSGSLKPFYSNGTMQFFSTHLASLTVGMSTARINTSATQIVLVMLMIAARMKPISFVIYVSSPIVHQKKSMEA